MDRALNPKLEKETIYEIYRGCRLCGAGAGYKMPIMQNVLDNQDAELNLTQKIRECVQIEVHADDKMPPLICELCVDKVNDYYEFLDMCRQTNKRTRLKLGLPLQSAPKGLQESSDCILGDTEPVYINSDSDGEPLAKRKSKPKSKEKTKEPPKIKIKKEPKLDVNIENILSTDRRSCRAKKSPPPPVRVTRTSSGNSNEVNSSKTQDSAKKSKPQPIIKKEIKSIMKKEKDYDKSENEPLSSLKRTRDKDVKTEVPIKKVKLVIEKSPKAKPSPKSKVQISSKPKRASSPARVTPTSPPEPVELNTCPVCSQTTKTSTGYHNHMRSHAVCFTNAKLACNACGEWFNTLTEASVHHKWHKQTPYKCRRCTAEFQEPEEYDDHFGKKQCIPFDEMPDVRCEDCWRYFATDKLLIEHKCAGEEGRPGGKCPKCNRTYVLLKNLIRHESTCLHRRRNDLNVDPQIMAQLRPVQIRVARCDPLLKYVENNHYDVANVTNYGFDENCDYPYSKHIKIKTAPFRGMVKINEEIERELLSNENSNWDSESDSEQADKRQSIRTVASKKMHIEELDTNKDLMESDDLNSQDTSDSVVLKDRDVSENSSLSVSDEKNTRDEVNNKVFNEISNLTEGGAVNSKDVIADKDNGNVSIESLKTSQTNSISKEKVQKDATEDSAIEKTEKGRTIDSVSARDTDNTESNNTAGDSQDFSTENSKDSTDLYNGKAKSIENGANGVNDENISMDKFNSIDDNEFDSEIDGDKLIAALNAQIGEDDETQNGDEKNDITCGDKKDINLEKKGGRLSLEELLAKDAKDLDTISDDFNFDV